MTEEELIALLLITIAAFLFSLLLHGAFVGATAVSTATSSSESSSGEVLLDNNAIVNFKLVRARGWLMEQSPVTIQPVLAEVPHGFHVDPDIQEVPKSYNDFTFANLKSIMDTIQSGEKGKPIDHTVDAQLGATMLDTDRGLITLDNTICASVIAYDLIHLLPINVVRPDGLRPISDKCLSRLYYYIDYQYKP